MSNDKCNWVQTMISTIKTLLTPKRGAQLLVILLSALGLKLYYSTASPNDLRWILAPTTFLVEFITGRQFEFESHAGYLSNDRTYLIAASCAGVNFLITAFLMLSLRKLWVSRGVSPKAPLQEWIFIPLTALFAYLATLVANTVRISIALWMQQTSFEIGSLSPNQLHRFEGIFIYFTFLLLLFVISERFTAEYSSNRLHLSVSQWLRLSAFPLLIYYGIMLGIPLANGAFRKGTDFWEHSIYVLLIPLPLILLMTLFSISVRQTSVCRRLAKPIDKLSVRQTSVCRWFQSRSTN